MSENIEEFIPEGMKGRHLRPPAVRKPRSRSATGPLLIVAGFLVLGWLFMIQPIEDRNARLDQIHDNRSFAPTAAEIRHREIIGTMIGLGLAILGGTLMVAENRRPNR